MCAVQFGRTEGKSRRPHRSRARRPGRFFWRAVSMLMAITTVLAALVALQWGYNPLLVAAVNGFFLVIELVFVAANMTKLVEGGWFPLLLACVIAFLMLTWRSGWLLLEHERSKLRQREDEFIEW